MNYNLQTFSALNRTFYVAELIQFNADMVAKENVLSREELNTLAKRKHKQTEFMFSRFIIKKIAGISDADLRETTVKYCNHLKTAGIFREQGLQKKLSLSHSGQFVAFTFCELSERIGIDIEALANRDTNKVKRLSQAFFCQEDQQYLAAVNYSAENFYRLWTEKEAVTKLVNTSVFSLLASSSIQLHANYQLASISQNGFVVTIAGKQATYSL